MLLRPPGQSRCQKQRMQGIMQNHAFGQEFAALGEREFGEPTERIGSARNGLQKEKPPWWRGNHGGPTRNNAAARRGGRLPQVSGHRRGTGPVPDFGENIADASYLGP